MSNGYTYRGNWVNDVKDGPGIEIDVEGNKSETTWVNNMRDGKGTYTKKFGAIE